MGKSYVQNIVSVVSNNGWLSEPFSIKRGIRQCCPY